MGTASLVTIAILLIGTFAIMLKSRKASTAIGGIVVLGVAWFVADILLKVGILYVGVELWSGAMSYTHVAPMGAAAVAYMTAERVL